jgi:hypothetical protein
VLTKQSPWVEGYDLLLQDKHSSASYKMMGPDSVVIRGVNNSKVERGEREEREEREREERENRVKSGEWRVKSEHQPVTR